MPLHGIAESELRDHCKRALEALEHWLRRLIDQKLGEAYGPAYLDANRPSGQRVIRTEIAKRIRERAQDTLRYPRPIDGAELDDLISIVCNPELYPLHFSEALADAFASADIARTMLSRLISPRNSLSHANSISVHDAHRVLCYSMDVIEALKAYYLRHGMHQQYNAPTVIRVMDSRGHIAHIPGDRLHSHMIDFSQVPAAHLRCGDTLSIEIEVDPSFDPSTFEIEWSVPNIGGGGEQRGPKFTHKLSERDVSAHYFVTCRVISNAAWHKLGLHDDQIDILYRVLPPL